MDTKRADDMQVGGTHYKKCSPEYQHWSLVTIHGWDYFQAQIIKYVMRFREKGGVSDLKKAQHFLVKLIELEEEKQKKERESPEEDVTPCPPPQYETSEQKGRLIKSTEVLDIQSPSPRALRKEKQKFPRSDENYVYEGGTKDYDLWRCRHCRDHFKTPLEADPGEFHRHNVSGTEPSASYVNPDK